MGGNLIRVLTAAGAMLAAAGGALAQGRQAAVEACNFERADAGTVRAVLDARTLVLTDGREVRLASIEIPHAEHAANAAKTLLEATLGDRTVTLKRNDDATDRYGRVAAHAFAENDARSAQQILLTAGHARVAARVGNVPCAKSLLAAERVARDAGRGLWADPSYAPRRADNPAALLEERGRFTLVEGRIVSVRESGGTIYVNFGRRWSEDFTATTPRRNERAFTAAGMELRRLGGSTVLLRGVVEERGGPWIEIDRPEQIQVIQAR